MKTSRVLIFCFLVCTGSVHSEIDHTVDLESQFDENSFEDSLDLQESEDDTEDLGSQFDENSFKHLLELPENDYYNIHNYDDDDDDDTSVDYSSKILTTTEENERVPTTSRNTEYNLEEIKNLILSKIEETSEKFCTKVEADEILSNLKSLEMKFLEKQKEIETKLEKITEEIVKRTESKFKKISEDLKKPLNEAAKYEYFKSNSPKSCYEALQMGNIDSGIYTIQPKDVSFEVNCDMETRGGGWTYILNRFNGSQDFYLNWEEYKNGFGDLNGEFWMGLEHLYELTGSEDNELLIELEDWENKTAEAHYDNFRLGDESQQYMITILGEYSGNAGDSLSPHVDHGFATKDRDNWVGGCAEGFKGAWWYHNCWHSHLTGLYYTGQEAFHTGGRGMGWQTFRGWDVSLKKAKMLIRPKAALVDLNVSFIKK